MLRVGLHVKHCPKTSEWSRMWEWKWLDAGMQNIWRMWEGDGESMKFSFTVKHCYTVQNVCKFQGISPCLSLASSPWKTVYQLFGPHNKALSPYDTYRATRSNANLPSDTVRGLYPTSLASIGTTMPTLWKVLATIFWLRAFISGVSTSRG